MRLLLLLMLSIVIAACGGGGSGGGDDNSTSVGITGGWIAITDPSDTGVSSTECEEVRLAGEAFISGDPSCLLGRCSGSVEEMTRVTVTWENLVTSTTGTAEQNVWECPFWNGSFLCDHTWVAEVPLVLGDNIIKVTAIDQNGSGGTDTITISKPEYSYAISGRLSTYEDVGMNDFNSGLKVELTGRKNRTINPSTDGQYRATCIPNGNYTITPLMSSFNYIVEPEFYTFSVAGQNVTDLEFRTNAYTVSGTIIDSSSGDPVSDSFWVELKSGNVTLGWYAPQGNYSFVVPNGTYIIRPKEDRNSLVNDGTFSPGTMTVEVTNSSLTGLDFEYSR